MNNLQIEIYSTPRTVGVKENHWTKSYHTKILIVIRKSMSLGNQAFMRVSKDGNYFMNSIEIKKLERLSKRLCKYGVETKEYEL